MNIILLVISFMVWLIFTWSLNLWSLTAGIVAALITLWFVGDRCAIAVKINKWKSYGRYAWVVVIELLLSGRDLWPILKNQQDEKSAIVNLATSITDPIGQALLINALNLSPGILVVDAKEGELRIHTTEDQIKKVEPKVRQLEALIKELA